MVNQVLCRGQWRSLLRSGSRSQRATASQSSAPGIPTSTSSYRRHVRTHLSGTSLDVRVSGRLSREQLLALINAHMKEVPEYEGADPIDMLTLERLIDLHDRFLNDRAALWW